MLVVADSSPFVGLIKIGHVDVLWKLYGSIVVPSEIAAELASLKRPEEVRSFIATPPKWLSVQDPVIVEDIPGIDPGERAAISLARQIKADILLIDENKGRAAAIARNIRTLRTTAMLLDAAKSGVLHDLSLAFERLEQTNFRVPAETLAQILREYELFRSKKQHP